MANKSAQDPLLRFSDRVENYARFRPSYPAEMISFLEKTLPLSAGTRVADIGSGTGILSRLFLERGYTVLGVEPNREMRAAAEQLLASYRTFTSVDARAEATGLPAGSIDLVVAAQAFHWFDAQEARREFQRILKPHGRVALIWNVRITTGTPFARDYEKLLLRYAIDYRQVDHRRVDEAALGRFFHPNNFSHARFSNSQEFDLEGLTGRLLSSSYAPLSGHPNHEPMIRQLNHIFNHYQQRGLVSFNYTTEVFWGKLSEE